MFRFAEKLTGFIMLRVFLQTYGCQMNVRDSEYVTGLLLEEGFKKADSQSKADIILFNSCSVRKHAEDKLFSNIAALKCLKEKKPGVFIGLIGCTAQVYRDQALKRSRLIDFVCGPGNEHELPRIIKKVLRDRHAIIAVDKVDKRRPEYTPKFRNKGSVAYISISEGCDNYCSYCIVPYVRGRERSRDLQSIVREAEDLASRGFKDIILLGQNVNSYHGGFVKLLEKIDKIEGIKTISFMTSHPKDAGEELFKAIGRIEKVSRRLHLPVQSGSDRILRLMNRGYTRKRYLGLVDMYKRIVPDGELTTDIIVGFPSETKKDFNDTLDLVKKAGFSGAYIFKYSPRPPAKASKLKDDVAPEEKQRRLATILDIQRDASRKRRRNGEK